MKNSVWTIYIVVCFLVGAFAIWAIGYTIGQVHPRDTDAAQVFFHNIDKDGKCTPYPAKEGAADLCKTEAGIVALCTATPGAVPDCKVVLDTRPRPQPQANAQPPAPQPPPVPAPKSGARSGSHLKE